MSDLLICPTCKGKKRFIGFGMMEKKCTECSGIGWIEKKVEENKPEVSPSSEVIELPINEALKRRGRPKKAA